jgi:misacylated tRNA(Ala) deacylase
MGGWISTQADALPPKQEIASHRQQPWIQGNHAVTSEWITDEELDNNPGLVKTMSVQPPRGSGRVRLIRIGDVDLQPCGGTHVARTLQTSERSTLPKPNQRVRKNRRVRLVLLKDD